MSETKRREGMRELKRKASAVTNGGFTVRVYGDWSVVEIFDGGSLFLKLVDDKALRFRRSAEAARRSRVTEKAALLVAAFEPIQSELQMDFEIQTADFKRCNSVGTAYAM